MNKIDLEPAYLLHTKPYSETSVIVDLLTKNHGRICALAKGARRTKSKLRFCLEMFSKLLVSYSGKGDLKLLLNVEFCEKSNYLSGNKLVCGFYINEILTYLTFKGVPSERVFECYSDVFNEEKDFGTERCLRTFEKRLLTAIGYAINLKTDINGDPIDPGGFYRYLHDDGFLCCFNKTDSIRDVFSGKSLIAFDSDDLNVASDFKEIKRLMRMVISYRIGGKKIKSRSLFS